MGSPLHLPGGPQTPVDGMLQAAAQQRQSEQMLMAVLQQAVNTPTASHRYPVNLTGIAPDPAPGGGKVLLVGLPTGERLEIPVSPDACRQIARHLLMSDAPAGQNGSSGGEAA